MFWVVARLICPLVIVVLMRDMGHGAGEHGEPSALALLEQRYTRVQIDRAAFERMRETLTRGHGSHVG